jgi:hypothetical protein
MATFRVLRGIIGDLNDRMYVGIELYILVVNIWLYHGIVL